MLFRGKNVILIEMSKLATETLAAGKMGLDQQNRVNLAPYFLGSCC